MSSEYLSEDKAQKILKSYGAQVLKNKDSNQIQIQFFNQKLEIKKTTTKKELEDLLKDNIPRKIKNGFDYLINEFENKGFKVEYDNLTNLKISKDKTQHNLTLLDYFLINGESTRIKPNNVIAFQNCFLYVNNYLNSQ